MKIPGAGNFFRYFAASLLALVIDVASFSVALRFFDLPWFWAAMIGFIFGAGVAYLLSVKWVFAVRNFRRQPAVEMAIFLFVGVLGLLLTELILLVSIDRIGIPGELAKLIAAVATFVFNYATRKAVLFSDGPFGFLQKNEVVQP